MPSMRFNARFDTSHHGQSPEVVVDRLIGIHNEIVKCPFVVNRSSIYMRFYVFPEVKMQRIQN
jgi:hypothetical protein